jgi:hypothetical protein
MDTRCCALQKSAESVLSPGSINNLKYILLSKIKFMLSYFKLQKLGFINWVQNITIDNFK